LLLLEPLEAAPAISGAALVVVLEVAQVAAAAPAVERAAAAVHTAGSEPAAPQARLRAVAAAADGEPTAAANRCSPRVVGDRRNETGSRFQSPQAHG